MYAKRRYGKRAGVRKYRRRGVRKFSKVSTKVRRYVKREIHRQIEGKEITSYAVNNSIAVPQSGGQSIFKIPLIPAIAVGGTTNQRIGNSIRPRQCYIKGHVNIKEYNSATNTQPGPIWVRMLLIKALNVTYQGGSPGELDTQIWKGNGTGLGCQSNMLDQCLEVNTDLFRKLYDKKFKIGAGANTSTGPVGSNYYFDNSPMSKPFFINWGKYVKKLLKFNDATNGNSVQNDNLYLLFIPSTADGQTQAGLQCCEVHYNSFFKFEDA